MPNQCVHCSEIYDDGDEAVLKGCRQCGSRFFFYMSAEKLNKIKENKEETVELTKSEKIQIEKDVREIAGIEDEEAPVILNFESVSVIKPGKYILDIPNLFSKERPLVYKIEDGKYIIDLASQLGNIKKI